MTFQETLTAAITDLTENGYYSQAQIIAWTRMLRYAAQQEVMSDEEARIMASDAMENLFRKFFNKELPKTNPGVGRFTAQHLTPKMRGALSKSVQANASLIKINKEEAVEKTLARFEGWATSIPPNGSRVVDKQKVKANISKPTREQRFIARRVTIDQGHKFLASLSEIVAEGSGAIAAIWMHHDVYAGYDPRPEHLSRNNEIFVLRNNWAIKQGLMKLDGHNYIDEIERPAELPFCRCYYIWITELAELPEGMLTRKGREWLKVAA